MAALVYIHGLRGPQPRLILDVDRAGNPVFGETERKAGVLATFLLGPGEERLPIAELMRRYPPPRPVADDLPPEPIAPVGGGVARELEVA